MLIGNDIIDFEQISINTVEKTALVASCRACIPMSARQRSQLLIKKVLNIETMTIPPRTQTFVPVVPLGLSDDRDVFFQPLAQSNLTLFSHLVDNTTSGILVCNKSQRAICLPCKQKLVLIIKMFYKNYFQASLDLDAAKMSPKAAPLHESCQKIKVSAMHSLLETKLPNKFRIYGN